MKKNKELESCQLSSNELQQYNRHINLPQIGIEGQQKLKNARVLCIGAGGLGSPLMLYLAAAGVGTLGIVDDDSVELSNLQRQVLYTQNDLSALKTQTAKQRLLALNPNLQIDIYSTQLTHENASDIISQYDIVADGTDNFATRYLINDVCFHLNKPNVFASIFQFKGQCSVFTTKNGPCYRCLYKNPPPSALIPNCAEGGVLGVLPGTMGTIQATEVIKLILNIGESLIGKLLTYDALTMDFRKHNIQKDPDCILCCHRTPISNLNYQSNTCDLNTNKHTVTEMTVAALQALRESNEDFLLLDVREPHEYEICHLNGKLIPLSNLENQLDELDKQQKIVVHCRSGARSYKAVQLLQKHGFQNAINLQGGILAWIDQIDPTLIKY